jgi:hypothetical protein
MQLSKLQELRKQPINDLNTIESVEIIDWVNGRLTAINHALNKATLLSNGDELDQQGITDLNQFCSDRIVLFASSSNELDRGLLEGYLAVKNYILNV